MTVDPIECHTPMCDYDEPHDHGFACGPLCPCGLGMQAQPDAMKTRPGWGLPSKTV